MRNVLLVLFCVIISININIKAQENVYTNTRNKVLEDMRIGDFAAAYTRIKLLSPLITDLNENDYQSLKQQLQDSLDNSYHRANSLKEKGKYELAIIEYQRLIGSSKSPLKSPLYAHIGHCYEKRGDNQLAKSNYELGMQHNENLSALRMAWYIRKNKIPATTEEMINLYEKAPNYYAAMDSLGVEYARLGDLNDSYKWFRKSNTDFSKYKMAEYLLDAAVYSQLADEYKTDDPIKLLTDASDNNYSPAQYYLGLLYYFAKDDERVKQDLSKGKFLIEKASSQRYKRASNMLYKIRFK